MDELVIPKVGAGQKVQRKKSLKAPSLKVAAQDPRKPSIDLGQLDLHLSDEDSAGLAKVLSYVSAVDDHLYYGPLRLDLIDSILTALVRYQVERDSYRRTAAETNRDALIYSAFGKEYVPPEQ